MRRPRRGLSLLEVMLAFVIILLVALHLMSMFASGSRHSVRAQQYSLAAFLAHSKIQELLTAPPVEIVEGQGEFLDPYKDYVYNVDVSPFEGFMVTLDVEVTSPRGAIGRCRTVVTEPVRFFGVVVDPGTNQVAFSPCGGSSIGVISEPAGTFAQTPATPDGRAVEGLAGRPGANLYWTANLRSGLLPYTEFAPATSWRPGLATPTSAIPPRLTGLAMDAAASRLFVGDASNRCLWLASDDGTPNWSPATPVAPSVEPLGAPAGVACDAYGSLVWIADRENQCLRKLHVGDTAPPGAPAGSLEAVPGVGFWRNDQYKPPANLGFGAPQGVAMDAAGWAVYVTDGGRIYRYLTATDTWNVVCTLPVAVADAGPSGIALDEYNNLLYVNCRVGQLWRLRLSDNTFTQLWTKP